MTTPDDLGAIIDRIEANTHTLEDLKVLRQLLGRGDRETISQLGKYNVNVGKGTSLEIGDRVYVEWSDKAIQALIGAIQTGIAISKQTEQVGEEEELEQLVLDVQSIELINSRLKAVENINQVGQLPEKQKEEFIFLKREVQSLGELNRKLKETAKKAQRLFQETVESLEAKLKELKLSKQDLVELGSQKREHECRIVELERQIEIAKQFEMNLESGEEASTWLNKNIAQFARSAGKYALEQYPEITSTALPRQIDNFYFSIEQFLERVSHCLSWGRYDMLDSSDIPLVFDVPVYEKAFYFVKKMLPCRLPDENKKQLEDYLDYLIQRLTYY
jgi:hypothetical protein